MDRDPSNADQSTGVKGPKHGLENDGFQDF